MSKNISVYLCYLLRHRPDGAKLDMDQHGWVSVDQLIKGVNQYSTYSLTKEQLTDIVAGDSKGRYRYSEDGRRIKCCQGHTIPWVTPELVYTTPPQYLYHGTTTSAMAKIDASGAIQKMKRHHVHMQQDESRAWQSANRWHQTGVVLKIDAAAMVKDGFTFGRTENDVWCTDAVPIRYICERLFSPPESD